MRETFMNNKNNNNDNNNSNTNNLFFHMQNIEELSEYYLSPIKIS